MLTSFNTYKTNQNDIKQNCGVSSDKFTFPFAAWFWGRKKSTFALSFLTTWSPPFPLQFQFYSCSVWALLCSTLMDTCSHATIRIHNTYGWWSWLVMSAMKNMQAQIILSTHFRASTTRASSITWGAEVGPRQFSLGNMRLWKKMVNFVITRPGLKFSFCSTHCGSL